MTYGTPELNLVGTTAAVVREPDDFLPDSSANPGDVIEALSGLDD